MNDEMLQQLMALTQVDELEIPGAIEAPEPEEFQPPVIKEVQSHPSERVKDLESDYATVRDNAHFQQQLLRMAAMKAFENASMSDAPRMMEVFATLMTQMTNNNKQILDIQKQMKDITQQEIATAQGGGGTVQSINAETAVFVGNSRDLLNEVGSRQEYLRSQREEEIIDVEPEEKVQKEDD
ncbi:terminase DNA packaging enzyme small subunit [Vibrio phage nt-1]|uniref:Terminase DNA packaging enzyme small subunit n=1 Tax=Vibrio phage nt-1 TaxID=115992 RepID=R9TIV9_9CAUD|nr:terminase small subunit [Vibrio phage nt-1]AGN30027.2 terminase DNA packaging enzyme small subunit [Vibrio phage nt-1]